MKSKKVRKFRPNGAAVAGRGTGAKVEVTCPRAELEAACGCSIISFYFPSFTALQFGEFHTVSKFITSRSYF